MAASVISILYLLTFEVGDFTTKMDCENGSDLLAISEAATNVTLVLLPKKNQNIYMKKYIYVHLIV